MIMAAAALALSLAATLYPSWRGARVMPAQALVQGGKECVVIGIGAGRDITEQRAESRLEPDLALRRP